ncbi:MAG: hypothetical protein Q9217_001608 [Psora testacea]
MQHLQDDAHMGYKKAQRFDEALSTLVNRFIPEPPGRDVAVVDERHDEALELARNIIEKHGGPAVMSDIQHAADLIKRKLLRDNGSPDKAVLFSNLYTRLLSQPVVSRKWEVLLFLHRLADSDDQGCEIVSKDDPGHGRIRYTDRRDSGLSNSHNELDDQTYRDAFATAGLPKLPTDDGRTKPSTANGGTPERRNQPRTAKQMRTTEDDDEPPANLSTTRMFEAALLRDLPFTLQGLSSTNLSFSSRNILELPNALPLPVVSILHTLAEPSLLYRSLSEFVESRDEGLVGQSLRSAIGNELRSYLGLISTLEGEIRRAIAVNTNGAQGRVGKVGVTLKRCVIWTRGATMGLRLMSLMIEEAKNKKGGQLISLIHSFSTSNGDPFITGFAERMLSRVTQPIYDVLREWIYDGELSDPYHEFFVTGQGSNDFVDDPRRAPATSVWEEKYKLDEAMIPSIITEEFARKVFLIGKSLNFIRYSCRDSGWVEAYSKEASRELKYGDTATLETSIDQAYKTTMARLIYLMDTKFQLFEHLTALKRYLLLGQGDFIALLMESLSSNLDRPAGSQYRHTLTAQLEHAIRGSNAQFNSPDILRRLDARLTEMEKGDTGWDVFTLEYKVEAPVDVIITTWANRQYLKIFNLLWRVKRVEFALGSTWRRCMTGARGVLASVNAKMNDDWKTARCAIAEMIHFVNQLQYYILFEVIEASWDALHTAISAPDCTLDDLISAHTEYLKAITHKGLLGSVRATNSSHREDAFTVQLHEILKIMLSYKESVDGLYSFSVAEFTRQQELAAKIKTRTAQGKWGLAEKDEDESNSPNPFNAKALMDRDRDTDSPFPIVSSLQSLPSDEESMLPALRTRLSNLSHEFKTRINNLLGDLAVQPDVDMRFLGVVMNFNDVYQPRKRRRHAAGGTGEKKTPGQGGEANLKREETGSGTVSQPDEKGKRGAGAVGTASKLAMGKGKERGEERKGTR